MAKISTKHQYKVIVERDEDGFYVASVPALPGCHTQARTLPELTRRVSEAIQLCLEIVRTNPRYRARIKQLSYEPTFIGVETVEV